MQKSVPFELKAPEKQFLNNGLPVYIFDNERLDLIHFALRIQAGSLFEPQKFLANPTYSLLMESVPQLSSGDVEDKLDFYGAVFQSAVSLEYVTLNFIIPKSTVKDILPFILSFISSPIYKEENLELYKQKKIKELEYNSRKVSYRSGQLLYHHFLNPQLSASELLTENHIAALSVQLLQQYHQATFCSENLSLFISGNMNDEILSLVKELFGQLPSGEKMRWPVSIMAEYSENRQILERRADSLQSAFIIGRAMMAYQAPERRPFSVLSTILGGYFGSRLMQNLREKNGFTYGIHTISTYFGDHSIFYLTSEVNIEKTQDALTECRYEMERLISEPVGDEELYAVKRYMEGALLRKLDGSVDYMRQYMLWQASGLDESEFSLMKEMIQEIDNQKIQDLASRYLTPSEYTTIVVGNLTND